MVRNKCICSVIDFKHFLFIDITNSIIYIYIYIYIYKHGVLYLTAWTDKSVFSHDWHTIWKRDNFKIKVWNLFSGGGNLIFTLIKKVAGLIQAPNHQHELSNNFFFPSCYSTSAPSLLAIVWLWWEQAQDIAVSPLLELCGDLLLMTNQEKNALTVVFFISSDDDKVGLFKDRAAFLNFVREWDSKMKINLFNLV